MFTAAEKPCNGRQAAVQQLLQDRIRSCCSVPGCLWAPMRTVQMPQVPAAEGFAAF